MSRPSCKHLILEAAENVVREGGAAHLTLDAVAEKAGVSKGGLLYHFPTKEALIEGMIAHVIERGHERRAATLESLPPGPARSLKAEILALLVCRDIDSRVSAGLLATVANEPKHMCRFRDVHRERFSTHTEHGSQPERVEIVLLAAYGLFFLELLQGSPFDAEQRQRLIDEMLRLSDEVVQDR
jgi:AcrR family transcriptional regulator